LQLTFFFSPAFIMNSKGRIILASYLVRFPLGGYAWQAAHYLLGLKSLGYDVWFYEDTDHYNLAYDPRTHEFAPSYEYGIKAAGSFLERIGFGDRWCFIDSVSGVNHGPGAAVISELLREADLLINVAGVNRVAAERRNGRRSIYVDLDPVYTQLRLVHGDEALRAILNEHSHLFTLGENIGSSYSATPTAGFEWSSTRQPVVIELWENAGPSRLVYTTVGKWDSQGRDMEYQGETFTWRKRIEWYRYLALPRKSGHSFELAMDVESVPGDRERLTEQGWHIVDPVCISTDPWRYRDYLRGSRGEFTVAKDMNVRLRSGWFSDRAACYLAAGRPVVEQDTGFGHVLPLGPGLHAFQSLDQATEAVRVIERDYDKASAHASQVAHEYFAADRVLGSMLARAG
jgi:hypothetical protein